MSSTADSQAFEMSLRDQLIAAQNNSQAYASHSTHQPQQHHANSHHDPIMGIQSYALPHPVSDPPAPATAKKGRAQRELSNTKRAAQNRAAQRAFRQRKEQHIHKLEDNLKILQQENYTLRDYIARLQAMLTDNKIAFPPAPEPLPQVSTSAPASDDQPSLQQQHHQEQHYTQSSPPQAHSPVPPHAYPPSSHSASQHAPLTNNHHPVRHEPADAITQLQAAAVQADDMATPYVPPPQQSSPQTSQYVPASEYPAENPATLTETRPSAPMDKQSV